MIVVVMITLVAWIILAFYAGAHPRWQRRAPSGHGHGQQTAGPAAPRREEGARAARPGTGPSAAAGRDPGASAAPATGIHAGRARAG
jgi:hypothetical protein